MDEGTLVGRNLDDRYRLLEMIGDGGMGQVFRAEQLATGRTVALKLLHSQFAGVAEIVQRFEREAKVTTHLSHPHIAKTVEFGERFQSARDLREALDREANGRNRHAVISGIETTVLAMPVAPRSRSRWLQVAIILAAIALLIGGHLAPTGLQNLKRIISAATGEASTADEPTRDGERSTVGGAQHSPATKKQGPKKARTGSKRNGSGI